VHTPSLSFLASLLLSLCLLWPLAAVAEEAAEREAELEALQGRIQNLRDALEAERGQRDSATQALQEAEEEVGRLGRDSATQALQEAEEEVGRLGRELRRTEDEIQSHRGRLAELEAEQSEREAEIEDEREALSRQIQGAYRTGREEQLKLLLNQEDPAAFGRMLVYYDYLNQARTERIERISEHVARLATLAEEVDDTLADLAEARRRQSNALDAMEATREAREGAVTQIEARLQDRGARLDQLEEDEEELQRLIRSLQDALDDIPSDLHEGQRFTDLRGELPWPVEGRVQRGFGDERAGGRMVWRGLLIAASEGDEVRSVSHGRVAYSGWLQHYGLVLIVDHGDGYLSLYGHNASVYHDVGDWVDPGDVIASVGDSGGQDRSGLYFEIRNGRDPVDPIAWLNRR